MAIITKDEYTIRLGLCCLNTTLRNNKPTVFCSRTLIRNNFTVEKAKSLAIQNIKDLQQMIQWNHKNGIKLFRITSNLFPRFTDNMVESYSIDFAIPLLKETGNLIKKYNHRVLMHPGQYNHVGANTEKVYNSTVNNLKHHADILDAMDIGKEGVLIVHGGGVYGNKEKTIKRWIKQFHNLPESVKNRLVLENCERSYNPKDCLRICKAVNIPMVYDCHHYECYKLLHPNEQIENIINMIPDILFTWKNGVIPLMHISEQGNGRIGHHSDYIETIPEYMLNIPDKYNTDIDLEVEAKMKEKAIFKLYNKYNNFFNNK